MSLPDSGWLTGLQRVPWWVFAGIAFGMACLRILGHSGIWIDGPGIIAFCLLVFLALDHWLERRKNRIRRRFKRLSEEQREFLIRHYKSGSRRIGLLEPASSARWIEELLKWNYIKWISPVILVPATYTYYITEQGWQEIKRSFPNIKP